jgi:RNA polymerase sigma-70 factor, ECF subfamily
MGHNVENTLRDQMLALLPNLRAFALSLTSDPTKADDLVQDTMLRAWAGISRFKPGTNLGAWLFTILRNSFYTEYRRRKREVEDPDGLYVGRLAVGPMQEAGLEIAEFRRVLARLPLSQQESLLLIGAEGLTYDAAALIQGVAVGTVKSRVHRARSQLANLLEIKDWNEFGPDRVMKAALQGLAALVL